MTEDKKGYSIATLGSHCSLQVLKGAKDEGFETLLVCERQRLNLYKRFKFIDEILVVENFMKFWMIRASNVLGNLIL